MMPEAFDPRKCQCLAADGDVHLGMSNQPLDQEAWRESLSTVAAADRQWLRDHPQAKFRLRDIDLVEMKMTGHPSDTQVFVARGPRGSQMRCFLLANT
jgi:hypothetical protein